MRQRGFNILDVEPAPDFLSTAEAREMGYGIYSARYGNIYTVRQLVQLLADANGGTVRDEDFVLKDGRYSDALRPNTEPAGYENLEETRFAREDHLARVRELFHQADVVVFTLGLTEAWKHRESGTVYPILPDTLTDRHSGNYIFHNFSSSEVAADLRKASAISSQQRYSENSVRLRADDDMPHPENDYFHMNGDYGAIMWEEVLSAIQTVEA